MNESSTAFARLADQARCRIEDISPYELDRAKPVVSIRAEIEAAFCNAYRVTFVGSTTPAFTSSTYSSVATW